MYRSYDNKGRSYDNKGRSYDNKGSCTIHFLCEFKEISEDTERYVPDP